MSINFDSTYIRLPYTLSEFIQSAQKQSEVLRRCCIKKIPFQGVGFVRFEHPTYNLEKSITEWLALLAEKNIFCRNSSPFWPTTKYQIICGDVFSGMELAYLKTPPSPQNGWYMNSSTLLSLFHHPLYMPMKRFESSFLGEFYDFSPTEQVILSHPVHLAEFLNSPEEQGPHIIFGNLEQAYTLEYCDDIYMFNDSIWVWLQGNVTGTMTAIEITA